jgi:hypothetical protein
LDCESFGDGDYGVTGGILVFKEGAHGYSTVDDVNV